MKSGTPFSKKPLGAATVGGKGQRSGFTDHVKSTNAGKGTPVKHMAATYPVKSTLGKTTPKGNPHTPAAKNGGSGKAGKSVAPFSKRKI